eukprot:jgi/Mesvir1/20456/Mv25068-RA.1
MAGGQVSPQTPRLVGYVGTSQVSDAASPAAVARVAQGQFQTLYRRSKRLLFWCRDATLSSLLLELISLLASGWARVHHVEASPEEVGALYLRRALLPFATWQGDMWQPGPASSARLTPCHTAAASRRSRQQSHGKGRPCHRIIRGDGHGHGWALPCAHSAALAMGAGRLALADHCVKAKVSTGWGMPVSTTSGKDDPALPPVVTEAALRTPQGPLLHFLGWGLALMPPHAASRAAAEAFVGISSRFQGTAQAPGASGSSLWAALSLPSCATVMHAVAAWANGILSEQLQALTGALSVGSIMSPMRGGMSAPGWATPERASSSGCAATSPLAATVTARTPLAATTPVAASPPLAAVSSPVEARTPTASHLGSPLLGFPDGKSISRARPFAAAGEGSTAKRAVLVTGTAPLSPAWVMDDPSSSRRSPPLAQVAQLLAVMLQMQASGLGRAAQLDDARGDRRGDGFSADFARRVLVTLRGPLRRCLHTLVAVTDAIATHATSALLSAPHTPSKATPTPSAQPKTPPPMATAPPKTPPATKADLTPSILPPSKATNGPPSVATPSRASPAMGPVPNTLGAKTVKEDLEAKRVAQDLEAKAVEKEVVKAALDGVQLVVEAGQALIQLLAGTNAGLGAGKLPHEAVLGPFALLLQELQTALTDATVACRLARSTTPLTTGDKQPAPLVESLRKAVSRHGKGIWTLSNGNVHNDLGPLLASCGGQQDHDLGNKWEDSAVPCFEEDLEPSDIELNEDEDVDSEGEREMAARFYVKPSVHR